jgi:hypothetical protein
MSSYQGVSFQSISRRGNVGLDEDELGIGVPDDPGFFGACSSCTWSLTRSSFVPLGITLMGSMSMTGEEVDAPTSPTAPCVRVLVAGGGVASLASGTKIAIRDPAPDKDQKCQMMYTNK